MRLKDKVVLVTGGAQGIGKEICLTCAREGAKIVVNYVDFGDNEAIAKATKAELESLGATVMLVQANVASFEETEKMFKDVVKEFGRVDVLVNNAGITKDGLLMRMKEEDFDKVIEINLKGTFLVTKSVIPYMLKKRDGKIINLASVVGVTGNAGQCNFSASKAGIIGFTKSIAKELASRNIRANAIAPGFIDTDMTSVLSDEVKDSINAQIPMKRMGTAQEIANVAYFLGCEESSYITGQVINIDGGMVM